MTTGATPDLRSKEFRQSASDEFKTPTAVVRDALLGATTTQVLAVQLCLVPVLLERGAELHERAAVGIGASRLSSRPRPRQLLVPQPRRPRPPLPHSLARRGGTNATKTSSAELATVVEPAVNNVKTGPVEVVELNLFSAKSFRYMSTSTLSLP